MENKGYKMIDPNCTPENARAIKDAMSILNGCWKLPILVVLSQGAKRFKEISQSLEGISDKMLSRDLKDLEINFLVKRTVYQVFPPRVEYEITEHTSSLKEVMFAMSKWGVLHRKKIIER